MILPASFHLSSIFYCNDAVQHPAGKTGMAHPALVNVSL